MSARPEFKGDYLGFTYNGKHSSELGIVRTSNGSRFDGNLLPTMQDKTVQVPGGDGTYYFGSYYTQRQFSILFAFDSLTEKQIAEMKAHFGDKKIHELAFDEMPYKTYRAKVTGSATIKYIPFAEGADNRLYKGEGTIQFTCYDPYAFCNKKWLSEYTETNIDEWKVASGLKEQQGVYDTVKSNQIKIYNPGDIDSHFNFKISFVNGKITAGGINLNENSDRKLTWSEISVQGQDAYLKINTRLNLLEGYDSNNRKTGHIYNQYLSSGFFFTIPRGEETLIMDGLANHVTNEPLEYFYYYL